MEPMSFAVGLAGLAGTFTACVECFGCIQFARSFGSDYSKSLLKLDIARLQITRWGASLGINGERPLLTEERISAKTADEFRLAQELLGNIEMCFECARKQSLKFIDSTNKEVEVLDTNKDLEQKSKELHVMFSNLALKRQHRASIGQKIKWAVYRKAKFESMIEDINDNVELLVKLFPAADRQLELCKEEVAGVEDVDTLKELRKVAGEQDKIFSKALEDEMGARGHSFKDQDYSGSAQVHAGDKNATGRESKGHSYSGVKAKDDTVVHLGNVNN